jgi:DNA-binding LacI/PurR family transcriptional regulator
MTKHPSIRDIAAAAGVSITTVSHALNGKGRLPVATRERVAKVASELGYTAHPQARGLATGRSMLLGLEVGGFGSQLLVPEFSYFLELVNAAAAGAAEEGYGLVLAPGRTAGQLSRLSVDGAVVVDPVGDEPLVRELAERGAPVVTTGRVQGGADVPYVDNDHRAGAHQVLDHLAERGYQRPALLGTADGPSYAADALAGYEDWCADHGIEPLVVPVVAAGTEAAAYEATEALLARAEPPDALYVTLDRMAVGALLAAAAAGLSVPGDLGIASLTDSRSLQATQPAVTALDLDPARIGREAVGLLIAHVEGRPAPESVRVEARLMPRRSTAGRSE